MKSNFKYICSVGAFALLLGAGISCSEEEPIYMPPTFKLNEVSDVMRTTARFSGSISGDVSKVKEYGFEYSTVEEFTSSTTQQVIVGDSTVSSSYDAVIRNLEANERYYYRMFASTGASKVYSEAEYFQTAASSAPLLSEIVVDSIGENLARFRCTVEDIGDEYLVEYGIEYKSKTDQAYIPISSDSILSGSATSSPVTYFVEINNLEPATAYTFRPYAANSVSKDGKSTQRNVGEEINKQTESLLSAEVVTSPIEDGHTGVSSIEVSATLKSATGSDGVINKCGFCWSQDNANPVITDDTLVLAPVKVGEKFKATIQNLSPRTRYYVRAYATNTVNGVERVGYGATYEVTTGGLQEPKVEFEFVENEWGGKDYNQYKLGPDSIHVKAYIDAKGFDTNTMVEKGFIWSSSNRKITLEEAKKQNTYLSLDLDKGAATTIEGTVKGLEVGSSYYIRAYVVAEADGMKVEGYTDHIEFRTEDFDKPYLTEVEIKDVTRSSATLVGKWEKGNGTIKEKGFCILKYTDFNNPELTTEGVKVVKADDDTFTEKISELKFNTRYIVRTYAIAELVSEVDTVYGWQGSFYTENVERPEFKSQSFDVSADTVRASTGLVKTGEGEIVERGFLWQEITDNMSTFMLEDSEHQKATGTDDNFSTVISGLKYSTSYRFSSYVKSLIDGDTVVHYHGTSHHFGTGGALRYIEHISSGLTSLTVKCGIQGSGRGNIVEKGFIWLKGTDGSWKNPSFEDNPDDSNDGYTGYKAVTDGTNNEFSLEIAGLDKNTRYFVRAYVKINCDGKETVSYSGTNNWYTEDNNMPNFGSMNVPTDSIGFSTAVLQTTINDLGNLPIVKKGFVVHLSETTSEPTLGNKLYQIDVTGDEMVAKLKGLKHNTRYSVRAFATCKVGDGEETVYSGNRNFGTKRPEETTFNNLRLDSASVNALYYTCGIAEVKDGEVIEKGFIWKERPKNNHNWHYPSFEDSSDSDTDGYTGYKAVESDSLQSYSIAITGLKPSTTYYVRSYAKVKVEEEEYVYYSNSQGYGTSSLTVNIGFEALADSCTVSGDVMTSNLPEGVEEIGICYSSNRDERIEDMKNTVKAVKAEDFDESGKWSVGLGNLEAAHEYKVGFYFILNGEEIRLDGEWWFTTKRTPSINDNVSPGKQGDE